MNSKFEDEVVAVGALGGSGTRAVAQLLIQMGIYMGDPLNFANDNTFYTACFMNPQWKQTSSLQDIENRISIFETYMRAGEISNSDLNNIERLPYSLSHQYPPELFPYLRKKKNSNDTLNHWGWKEPNTHIYLRELADYFPRLKYIHVLRHGLDMAFAKNKKQLINWGSLYGIEAHSEEDETSLAQKQLEYWIRSTQAVLKTAEEKLGDRFYLLRYEDFCLEPKKHIPELLKFLGFKGSIDQKKLNKVFKLSKGSGRYKDHKLDIFSSQQLAALQNLGFSV